MNLDKKQKGALLVAGAILAKLALDAVGIDLGFDLINWAEQQS